jgi:acyl carrier protein
MADIPVFKRLLGQLEENCLFRTVREELTQKIQTYTTFIEDLQVDSPQITAIINAIMN